MKIRLMKKADLSDVSNINQTAFIRQKNSFEWLQCNLNASSRFLNFIAESNDQIVGYIIWSQKSGFRAEAVVELEQLAVLADLQGQGIGRKLIKGSLSLVKEHLMLNGSKLKHILVTTRADNHAQQLYKSTLNAKVETIISNLYSADEVLMIARNVSV